MSAGVLAVLDAAPSVTVRSVTVLHNTISWCVKTNRHPNCDNTDWGWIDGAPGNVCWSNNETFNREAAQEMVAAHNKWIEDQKPLSIKLVEARDRYFKAKSRNDSAHAEYVKANASMVEAEEALTALARAQGGAK